MTDRDDSPTAAYEAALAQLDKATAAVRRHETALETAKSTARDAAVKALRLGLEAKRKRLRTEVLKHSPFSPTTLRAMADDAGIPPDERYVRTRASD